MTKEILSPASQHPCLSSLAGIASKTLVDDPLVIVQKLQLGSKMKLTVFRSESTGVALKGWAKSAKKRHSHPDHVHVPISPNSSISNEEPHVTKKEHHLHVLGLDKQVDAGGHVVDIVPGTTQHLGQKHQHNDHNHLNGDDHHQNPKPVHVHAQGTHSIQFTSSTSLLIYLFTLLFNFLLFEGHAH